MEVRVVLDNAGTPPRLRKILGLGCRASGQVEGQRESIRL